MSEQAHSLSLNDVRKRFEQLGPDKEFEITGVEEFTVTVTVSMYRSTDSEGKDEIPLECHLQFDGDSYASLIGPGGKDYPLTFEDVTAAFGIQPDDQVWEISIDDEDE